MNAQPSGPAKPAKPALSRRSADLARIHVGAKKLGMDQGTYRQFLFTTAGVRSAADLDVAGRKKVIARMHALGLPEPQPHRGAPHNMLKLSGEIEKIEAQLADMSLTWSYADAIARRMFGVQRIAWLRKPGQLRAILAALHVEQQKRDGLEWIDRALAALGRTRADLDAFLATRKVPDTWSRNREWLKRVGGLLDTELQEKGITL